MNKIKGIWKESVIGALWRKGPRRTTRKHRIAGDPVEVRTEYIPNTRQERGCYVGGGLGFEGRLQVEVDAVVYST
jgi:hypothetical protein